MVVLTCLSDFLLLLSNTLVSTEFLSLFHCFQIHWFAVFVFLTDRWKKRECGDESLFSNKYHESVHASRSRGLFCSESSTLVWFPKPASIEKFPPRDWGHVPRGNELDTDITEELPWPWQEIWDVIIIGHLSTFCTLVISKVIIINIAIHNYPLIAFYQWWWIGFWWGAQFHFNIELYECWICVHRSLSWIITKLYSNLCFFSTASNARFCIMCQQWRSPNVGTFWRRKVICSGIAKEPNCKTKYCKYIGCIQDIATWINNKNRRRQSDRSIES